jgi:hypothetical protein
MPGSAARRERMPKVTNERELGPTLVAEIN